ncbi:MAG: DUF4255 domain-containing protein [Desulfobacterales bacterium]|nr:DUF4255 domain-containing protein [Desulfobacterales bacterium]
MALNPSGLSEAVLALRRLLGQHINGIDENRINIGAPKQTQDELTGSDQQLSIFVYNAQISPNTADVHPLDTPTVRLHCLITPFGVADAEANISAGENELRLMGEVLRVMHENPSVTLRRRDGRVYASIQLMLKNVDEDHMNKIWSAQPDTAYRLSVGCELALVPVTIDPAGAPQAPETRVVQVRHYPKPPHGTDPRQVIDNQTPDVTEIVKPE